jgi:hypothetical protein
MRSACLLMCGVVAGCSFSLAGPPPGYQPQRHGPPRCDRDDGGLALLDGLAIAFFMLPVAIGTAIAFAPSADAEDRRTALIASGGGALLAGLPAAAIARGQRVTARCAKAHLDFERWAADQARVWTPSPRPER